MTLLRSFVLSVKNSPMNAMTFVSYYYYYYIIIIVIIIEIDIIIKIIIIIE